MKIANKNARHYVQNTERFEGNNMFGYWWVIPKETECYVVYSYGHHFPMYIYSPMVNRWFENSDKYSLTTSKHQSQAHPHTDTVKLNTEYMQRVIKYGPLGMV